MSSATRRTSCTAIWRKSRGPVTHDRLAFCFGIHNHQPIGNFDHVFVEATERAYRPFLERLQARPEVRLAVHCTGSLLEWLRERSPRTFDLLAALAERRQVELLTGGFYEPILAVLPDHDKFGQIERLTAFLKTHFGVRPRGMWLAERVWEPHLPRVLAEAGVEYVLVDDSHFALAGLDPDTLGGYYLTEDQGVRLRVFPISQRLRYLIPFAEVEASLEYLAARRGRVPAVTMVDDGEKFGVWPATHAHVYEKGWLDRFFDRLLATDWLALTTLADVVDRVEATDRVYLPTASYREMGEWALPVAAQRTLERAKHDLERLGGGADHADLWRGQANDAYWHGVFGGCYLPHLRRAVKSALLECERRLAESAALPTPAWTREDGNGDGREEIYVRTRELAVTLNPALGGAITELGYLAGDLDVADVLARRPEAYHAKVRGASREDGTPAVKTIHDAPAPKEAGLDSLLAYDDVRRGSLLEGWFDAGTSPLDPVSPWAQAALTLAAEALASTVSTASGGVAVTFTRGAGASVRVEKTVTIRDATVEVRYRLGTPAGMTGVSGRWAVQFNVALTAGGAPGRYLTATGRPALGRTGRERGAAGVR